MGDFGPQGAYVQRAYVWRLTSGGRAYVWGGLCPGLFLWGFGLSGYVRGLISGWIMCGGLRGKGFGSGLHMSRRFSGGFCAKSLRYAA